VCLAFVVIRIVVAASGREQERNARQDGEPEREEPAC
jgi:hypothetical protein